MNLTSFLRAYNTTTCHTTYYDKIPAHSIPMVVCTIYNSSVPIIIVIVDDSCGYTPQHLSIGGVCQTTHIYHKTY